MGETSNDIVQRIEAERARLGQSINDLEDRVKTAVNWRYQFERHPGMLLGLAFGGGLLLSWMVPRWRRVDHGAD